MSEQNSERTVADAVDQNEEDLKRIKEDVHRKHGTSKLRINRVPDDTIDKFKSLAASKMANDYGLTLAYLLEMHELRENYNQQLSQTNDKVLQLQEQVQALRQEIIDEKNKDDESKVDTIG